MNLNITIIQHDIVWEDSNRNFNLLEDKIALVSDSVDLIVLPEMFHCGFTMKPEQVALTHGGIGNEWMQKMADFKKCCILGSLVIVEDGKFYNRLYVHFHNAEAVYYNKRHLFRMGGENLVYEQGTEPLIFQYKGWRIKPLICYDLRFPVWSRNQNDYDLLIYVANWPESRRDAWMTLLKARSIENQCYVIGVNRVGIDSTATYTGDSLVFSPKGEELLALVDSNDRIGEVQINKDKLDQFRDKFPAWEDADDFMIIS